LRLTSEKPVVRTHLRPLKFLQLDGLFETLIGDPVTTAGNHRADLDALLWRERWLFEYWAHAASIVLTEDYPIHHTMTREYRVTVKSAAKRHWLAANEGFPSLRPGRAGGGGPLPAEPARRSTRCARSAWRGRVTSSATSPSAAIQA
jgi:uncharacterized protein YcaQ